MARHLTLVCPCREERTHSLVHSLVAHRPLIHSATQIHPHPAMHPHIEARSFAGRFPPMAACVRLPAGKYKREQQASRPVAVGSCMRLTASAARASVMVYFSPIALLCGTLWPAFSVAITSGPGPGAVAGVGAPKLVKQLQLRRQLCTHG